MHKVFYASGFLYHPTSQKILLHQANQTEDTPLTLFSGKSHESEDEKTVLQRVFLEKLNINIPRHAIHPIYDYASNDNDGDHFICYAVVGDTVAKRLGKNPTVKWVPLEKLQKLKATEQTKQDITVGQRVINLADRQRLEKEAAEETNLQK